MIVVFVTVKDKKEAKFIAGGLLKEKLAACVNIVDNIESLFWWQGKIDNARECLLIIKSRESLLKKIIKKVKDLHSYTCPEIIALSIIGGNKDYLDWIEDSVKK